MGLNRPYIRNGVREEVERRSPRNEEGNFLDANTGAPIEGAYDLGHKPGHEHWREAEKAEREGLSQADFNDRMNNPDLYQIENPSENRSRKHEMKDSPDQNSTPAESTGQAADSGPGNDGGYDYFSGYGY